MTGHRLTGVRSIQIFRHNATAAKHTTRNDPPFEMNGSGNPVIGIMPTVIAVLIARWLAINATNPNATVLA